MSAFKKKFRDKVPVHSTKAGSQFVRPSDILLSEEVKKDMNLIREAFKQAKESTSELPTDENKKAK
jgi:hypothetical protein